MAGRAGLEFIGGPRTFSAEEQARLAAEQSADVQRQQAISAANLGSAILMPLDAGSAAPPPPPTIDWGSIPGATMAEKLAHLRGMAAAMQQQFPQNAQLYAQSLALAQAEAMAAQPQADAPAPQAPRPTAQPVAEPAKEAPKPSHKVTSEADDHFVIDDGSGQPFKVAKAGLGEKMIGQIRGYASGGEVQPNYAGLPDYSDPNLSVQVGAQPIPTLQELWAASAARSGAPSWAMAQPPAQPIPDIPTPLLASQQSVMPQQPGILDIPGAPTQPGVYEALAPQQPQQPAPQQAGTGGSGQPRPSGGAPRPDALGASVQQADQAGHELAALQQQQSAEQTAAYQQWQDQIAAKDAQIAAKMAERQAIADRKHEEILASNIDPSRLWHNIGIGGQMGATIGMLLGGIGAMANGGKNMAVEQLNRTIDRDIEAQKIDLGTKQTDLEMYLREGKDMFSAERLTRADLLDKAAAQAKLIAMRYGGQEAMFRADAAGAEMRQQAMALRSKLASEEVNRAVAIGTLQLQRAQLGASMLGGAGGQKLPASEAAKIGDAEAALQSVNFIDAEARALPFGAAGTQYIAGTKAGRYEDKATPAAQVVGRYLEDGKLTDADFPRYLKMMPTPGDSDQRKQEKAETLRRLINIKRTTGINALKRAGFNTSGFGPLSDRPDFKPE